MRLLALLCLVAAACGTPPPPADVFSGDPVEVDTREAGAPGPDATPDAPVGMDVAQDAGRDAPSGADARDTAPPVDTGPCPAGQRPCGGRCVDVQSDMMNCGRCGNPCEPDFGGACCAGVCVQLETDATNCGACGRACMATLACVSRTCRCGAERPFICGDRCADLRSDPMNCGACGTVCPAGQRCVSSACTP